VPSRLDTLLAEIRACRLCRDGPIGAPLPHEPRPVLRAKRSARLGIFSQAPGTRVHASGTPFLDASGDRLRGWLGVDHETFYDQSRVAIVPMGFCFPGFDANGDDLPPRPECAPRWRDRVMAELPRLELCLLIGQYAQRWHLGKSAKLGVTSTVAAWRGHLAGDRRPRLLCLPHPSWRNTAWLKRNPWFEAELVPVLQAEVGRLLGRMCASA
jgi:uracil-DNA glycosylase